MSRPVAPKTFRPVAPTMSRPVAPTTPRTVAPTTSQPVAPTMSCLKEEEDLGVPEAVEEEEVKEEEAGHDIRRLINVLNSLSLNN